MRTEKHAWVVRRKLFSAVYLPTLNELIDISSFPEGVSHRDKSKLQNLILINFFYIYINVYNYYDHTLRD